MPGAATATIPAAVVTWTRRLTPGEVLLALPLVVDPWGFHRFVALRFLVAAGVIAVGLARARAALPPTRVRAAWLTFLAVTTAATFMAHDVAQAVLGDPVRMMGLSGWLLLAGAWVLGGLNREVPLSRYRDGLVVVASLASVAVIVQEMLGQTRPSGPMGNAVFLGALLCLSLPATAHGALACPGRARWVFTAVGAVQGIALVLAQARGAVVGVAVSFAVLAALRGRRGVAVGLGVAGLIVAIAMPVARTTAQGRLDTWQETAEVVAERPILGWGPEGFRSGFGRHVSADWVRTYELRQIPDRAHNAVLDVTVSSGLLGAAAYLALVTTAALAMWRARHAPGAAGLVAGAAGYLVQAQFSFDTFDLGAMTWFLVGAVSSRTESETVERPRRWGVIPAAATVLVAVGVAAVAADRLVASASDQVPERAYSRLALASRLWPHSFDAGTLAATVTAGDDRLVAQAHDRFGTWPDPYVRLQLARARGDALALETLRSELPTNPDLEAALGAALLRRGDLLGARHAYERATFLAPRDAEVRAGLAATLFSLGRDREACDALVAAIRLVPADQRPSLEQQRGRACS